MVRFTFQLGGLESDLIFRDKTSHLNIDLIEGFKAPSKASDYLIFGDEEYNIGTAFYCEDPNFNYIYRVCPEHSSSFEFVNSDMTAFLECLRAATQWSTQHSGVEIAESPEPFDCLAQHLAAIDPVALRAPDSHWSSLIDHMRECAEDWEDGMHIWFRTT